MIFIIFNKVYIFFVIFLAVHTEFEDNHQLSRVRSRHPKKTASPLVLFTSPCSLQQNVVKLNFKICLNYSLTLFIPRYTAIIQDPGLLCIRRSYFHGQCQLSNGRPTIVAAFIPNRTLSTVGRTLSLIIFDILWHNGCKIRRPVFIPFIIYMRLEENFF